MKSDLKNKIIGRKIYRLKEIDSTNEEAKRLAEQGAAEGTVVLAESQREGKGKPGKSFSSKKGGVYLSVILKPYLNQNDLPRITLYTCRAVASVIRRLTGLKAETKWPNDVLIAGKKISGILAEVSPKNSLIVGIGINVSNPLPLELKKTATSLKDHGCRIGTKKLISVLLKEFEKAYHIFLTRREL